MRKPLRSLRLRWRRSRARLEEAGESAVDGARHGTGKEGDQESGDDAGVDVHGPVGAEGEDGEDFEEGDGDAEGDEAAVEAGEFDGAEDGESGVAGEEEVVGDAVGDQEAGETGVSPDHLVGGGEDADGLEDLAETE